jgi:glycosyltransferase involved in cell wall biosynthesis
VSITPRVSVVVPVRNAAEAIPEFLACLAAQDLPREEREVLIIDDASTDDTAGVAGGHPDVRVLRLDRWSGAYAARNCALEEARGTVIALTDADCRPRPDWLRVALGDLEELGADVLVGHVDVPLSAEPGVVELVDFCRYLDQERALREARFGATANLVVRRSVLDAVGAFNERVISDGDRELCRRAEAAGFALRYSQRAAVVHAPRTRPYDLARRGFRDGVGRAQMRRHAIGMPDPLPAIWRRPGAYLPSALIGRKPVYGVERLQEAGFVPTRRQRTAMAFVEWACVQLPMIAGNLVGDVREALGPR